jgi:hypothetical protein
MTDSQKKVIKLSSSRSRGKMDGFRATVLEELEEFRGNFEYFCETCENGVENHPGDMRKWLSALQSLNMECSGFFGAGCFSRASGRSDFKDEIDD